MDGRITARHFPHRLSQFETHATVNLKVQFNFILVNAKNTSIIKYSSPPPGGIMLGRVCLLVGWLVRLFDCKSVHQLVKAEVKAE